MKINEKAYSWAANLIPRTTSTHLIIHHCAGEGSPDAIHSYHRSLGWAGIAYHYYVRRDGTIYRGRPEEMRGGHTTNWNWCSIGICFEGNFENETMGAAQKLAGAELISDIAARHPGIVVARHSEFGATSCPGQFFPFSELSNPLAPESEGTPEDNNNPDIWAKSATDWAVDEGIFKGDENGAFHWRDSVSRQELAVILQRLKKI